jgi:hypothetical protein
MVVDHRGQLAVANWRCATHGSPPDGGRGGEEDRPSSDFAIGLAIASAHGGGEELREEAASCRSKSGIHVSCLASRIIARAIIRSCAAAALWTCSSPTPRY